MPCFYPLDAWQGVGGDIHFYQKALDGHRRTTHARPNYKRDIKLPCGRCTGCRLERSRQWAVRCLHESQQHQDNCFVTLTINDKHLVPMMGISRDTHQKFMKRLRKHTGQKIRYYMCGEYGEQLQRPHYHYILFGIDFPDKYKWRENNGNIAYRSPTLEKIWPYGHAEISAVNFETCAYVARYVMKKITGNLAHEHYRRTADDGTEYWLTPEFNYMSRNPGIASTWWRDFHTEIYPHDEMVVRGAKAKPPRYYDQLLEKFKPLEYELIKKERELEATNNRADNTPRRLKDKETVLKAKLALKKRTLENQ